MICASPAERKTVHKHIMTAPRGTGWNSRLIVAQVYLVTGGSVYVVTEELTESRLYAEEIDPR